MHNEQGAYVCILRCSDGSYYAGTARLGLEQRLVKGWSRRKKEALIAGDYDALRALASRSKRAREDLTLRDAPCGRSSG
jgi:predicted GIY-YIG superfamily endonuclease